MYGLFAFIGSILTENTIKYKKIVLAISSKNVLFFPRLSLYFFSMHSESITTSPFIVQEDTILLDDGKLENLEIIVSSGVKLQYLLLPSEASHNTRTFHVHAHATFIGAGVYHHADMVQKLSVIINGNNISADLKLLTLLRDHARISVDGIGRVEKGSENIHLRVDQTNILLGKDIAIQGRPVLEIETDSIEG